MKHSILFLFFILIGNSNRLWGQLSLGGTLSSFNCQHKWGVGLPITASKLPDVSNIEVEYPSTINLRVIFWDFDAKKSLKSSTCPGSATGHAQSPTATYKVIFSLSQAKDFTTFDTDSVKIVTNKTIMIDYNNPLKTDSIPDGSGGNIQRRLYEAFISLQVKDLWAVPSNQTKKVILDYTIRDSTDLPPRDTGILAPPRDIGTLQDPDATGQWVLSYKSKECPTQMISLKGNPPDSNWYKPLAYEYNYAVGDTTKNFLGKVINEKLTGPLAAGTFSLSDMELQWLMDFPGKVLEEDIVRYIFIPPFGNPHSWIIEKGKLSRNQFNGTDSHGEFDDAKAIRYFNIGAIIRGVSCYKIEQEYTCNNNTIGKADILKRVKQNTGTTVIYQQYKKKHYF